jgi:hypothetical protein
MGPRTGCRPPSSRNERVGEDVWRSCEIRGLGDRYQSVDCRRTWRALGRRHSCHHPARASVSVASQRRRNPIRPGPAAIRFAEATRRRDASPAPAKAATANHRGNGRAVRESRRKTQKDGTRSERSGQRSLACGADDSTRLPAAHVERQGFCRYPGIEIGRSEVAVADAFVVRLINTAMHRGRRGARLARRDDRGYREYLREEQRSQPGCIGGRMPPYL